MPDFVAYSSRWRVTLLILAAAAFVGTGLWMAGVFGAPPGSRRYPAALMVAIGWFGVIFFGLCGVVAIKKLLDTGEQLRVGPSGICWTPWSDLTIPWSEITDVTGWEFRGQKTIVLHLRDPDRFPAKRPFAILAGANRALTGGDISISLAGTDRSFPEALAAIQRFRTRDSEPPSQAVP